MDQKLDHIEAPLNECLQLCQRLSLCHLDSFGNLRIHLIQEHTGWIFGKETSVLTSLSDKSSLIFHDQLSQVKQSFLHREHRFDVEHLHVKASSSGKSGDLHVPNWPEDSMSEQIQAFVLVWVKAKPACFRIHIAQIHSLLEAAWQILLLEDAHRVSEFNQQVQSHFLNWFVRLSQVHKWTLTRVKWT